MHFPPELTPRDFAVLIVERLRAAGHEAFWAGGCVRDQLLGKSPKDYDVATAARPEQVREVFGKKLTKSVGAAFGVITVHGPKSAGTIEVATFRSDAAYSDGRHPDSVTFSTPEHDAQRRDFTINGLFYDPLADRVIDFVGGQQDLERQVIRAIGDPHARIAEDKLRMLRAVRFAITFNFTLDPTTLAALQQNAGELVIVAAERVAAELRRMLVHPHRARAVRLLQLSGLLGVMLPELAAIQPEEEPEAAGPERALHESTSVPQTAWRRTCQVLSALESPSFSAALATLVREVSADIEGRLRAMEQVGQRLKLANEETDGAAHVLAHEATVRVAESTPWPQLQRLLIAPGIEDVLTVATAIARVERLPTAGIDYCREKLALPPAVLNPPPLVTGDDLIALGLPPGPAFKAILLDARDLQLAGTLTTREAALAWVARHRPPH